MKERNPSKKKKKDYKKQHFNVCEYPYGFNRRWKKKKRLIQKIFRSKSKQNLFKYIMDINKDYNFSLRRKEAKKWGTENLQSKVNNTIKKRIQRFSWNFFKDPYNTKKHKSYFTEVIKNIIEGRSDYSKEYALLFHSIMNDTSERHRIYFKQSRTDWLTKYFTDCPEMEIQLRKWINNYIKE